MPNTTSPRLLTEAETARFIGMSRAFLRKSRWTGPGRTTLPALHSSASAARFAMTQTILTDSSRNTVAVFVAGVAPTSVRVGIHGSGVTESG